MPKQTLSRYVRTQTFAITSTTLSRRRRPRLLRKSVNSREVRRSLTWHSSESESALERFEPVAVVKLQRDGWGSVFAPVAARRQKEFKRGKLSSFCPFRSFRTSEKNIIRKVTLCFYTAAARPTLSRRRQHTCFAYVLIPATPLYAGVQTMRARICSAISCDMFARVVYLRLRGAAKPSIFALPRTARTCHAWLARLTRARGERFQREGKALFDDFCRAFGHSKAR